MEENFTPTELFLGMKLAYLEERCPFECYGFKDRIPFCEGGLTDEDEVVCPKMHGNGWVTRIGVCWARYARNEAEGLNTGEIESLIRLG
ncbi:hypothetical protein B5F76_09165 [Desulfovibrio sp. An276]|uniref:hypothetical protein n=1 Tax=Desulfovibrio sp. An276 TaxID=1965618 RepID=UPI000B3AC02A|nr:hypothetical protein [Desulfovibrio sp. An276]OUO51643.1 hypothetical protein B5F76_09165 [Desulfovibrio sp. An276]